MKLLFLTRPNTILQMLDIMEKFQESALNHSAKIHQGIYFFEKNLGKKK